MVDLEKVIEIVRRALGIVEVLLGGPAMIGTDRRLEAEKNPIGSVNRPRVSNAGAAVISKGSEAATGSAAPAPAIAGQGPRPRGPYGRRQCKRCLMTKGGSGFLGGHDLCRACEKAGRINPVKERKAERVRVAAGLAIDESGKERRRTCVQCAQEKGSTGFRAGEDVCRKCEAG
jgi:hypothetical protein